jgi:hypothetical protein
MELARHRSHMSSELAKRLLKKNRKVAATITIDVDGTSESLTVLKPTVGDRLKVIEQAKKDGELDEKGEPKDQRSQVMLGARMVKALLCKDGMPVFADTSLEELVDWAGLEEVIKECANVFSGEETAKKSEPVATS